MNDEYGGIIKEWDNMSNLTDFESLLEMKVENRDKIGGEGIKSKIFHYFLLKRNEKEKKKEKEKVKIYPRKRELIL